MVGVSSPRHPTHTTSNSILRCVTMILLTSYSCRHLSQLYRKHYRLRLFDLHVVPRGELFFMRFVSKGVRIALVQKQANLMLLFDKDALRLTQAGSHSHRFYFLFYLFSFSLGAVELASRLSSFFPSYFCYISLCYL